MIIIETNQTNLVTGFTGIQFFIYGEFAFELQLETFESFVRIRKKYIQKSQIHYINNIWEGFKTK
jgi:hypothetical protein